jgi:CheY-like chemotaxis protein
MEWGRSADGHQAPADGPAGEPDGAPESQPGGCRGRVLVCEDTEQIRRLIRVNLELDGYEVVEAEDGPAALEILQDVSRPLPDVITVDVVMPRRDGWWMVSTIRADPRLADIPIVMVTASAQYQDRAHAERAAVDGFVAKPFDPEELLLKIEALVAGHHD